MSSLITSFLLALAPVPATVDEATVKELAALTNKLTEAENYTFDYLPMARPAAARPAEGGAEKPDADDDDKDPVAWNVEIDRKTPWHYKHGESELFRHEMHFAIKGKDGKWMRAGGVPNLKRPPAAGAGGAPPKGDDDGDDGNDGKKPEGGEKGGRRDRRAGPRGIAAAEAVPLAHQILHDLDKRVTDVTKDAKPGANGEVVYVATLTPAAARELSNEGRSLRTGKGGEGRAPGKAGGGDGKDPAVVAGQRAPEFAATLRIGVKDGAVASIDVDAITKAPGGERHGGGRITLSKVNATKIVVPAEAQAQLEPAQAPHDGGAPGKK